ncbi:MAG: glycosyltransferase [Gammaproteobacteria bacterium]|nr:glycosyltransferase [Gammaproteobacteria bacterium]
MRVLHLIKSEGVYGAERILLYLALEQQRAGEAPYLGSIGAPGCAAPAIEALARAWQLPVLPLRVPRLPTPGAVRTLLAAAREVGADVLHSHGFKSNVLLGPLARDRRPPMLSTLHGWTAGAAWSRLALYEALDRWALRRIESVAVVTRAMLELPAVRALPAQRVRVIENGVPEPGQRAQLAQLTHAPLPESLLARMRERPTLLAIGRLSVEKGFDELIAAFAAARSAGPHQLLIVGEGPEEARLRQRVSALGLAEDVHLSGYVEGADRLLTHAAGLVMSSRTEGMPVVLLEAMQAGIPVIATAVGAIPQLLEQGRGGELVASGDRAALSAALRRLIGGAGSAPAGADLRARFSSARMAREYLDAYRAIT